MSVLMSSLASRALTPAKARSFPPEHALAQATVARGLHFRHGRRLRVAAANAPLKAALAQGRVKL
jgi:hypothetical protein